MRQSRREEEGHPGGGSEDEGERPWAGSAEREKEGGLCAGQGASPGDSRAARASRDALFQPLLAKAAVLLFGGKPANQIGQQTGDLCGVGTARVSLTVYPAVFFKTEISARVTTAVSYWLWLRGLCAWGGGGGPLRSALLCMGWKLLKECVSPRPGSRWEGGSG